ncbi:MAG: T9SS type A sorting domain-containing protein [Cytophagaceae bacterium]|jgi:hypothetical protein|nr:T9SS type A sorting domain-containing protein [Cytophagaceae bacterium]
MFDVFEKTAGLYKNTPSIDIHLLSGIYFVQITTERRTVTKKVLKN